MSSQMSKELTKKYADKIIEVVYYDTIPDKETVGKVIYALIDELSGQQTKELQERFKQLQAKIDELEKANSKHIEWLKEIRNNPKTWKSGGFGGQDQYAGLPPMLRYIDEMIDQLKNKY